MTEPIFKQQGSIDFPDHLKHLFEGYLAREENGVIISFISSKQQGKGHFSELLKYLKQEYEYIKIPTPSNKMKQICLKKGFQQKLQFFPEPFNEIGEILIWVKEAEGNE